MSTAMDFRRQMSALCAAESALMYHDSDRTARALDTASAVLAMFCAVASHGNLECLNKLLATTTQNVFERAATLDRNAKSEAARAQK